MGLANVTTRRWTRAEFYRMVEAGVLGPDDKVELIEGEVVPLSAQSKPHADSIAKANRSLNRLFGGSYVVRPQLPLDLGNSQPEPDFAIVGEAQDYLLHPTSALLVIEIAHTSLAYDRYEKASIYAQAKLPEYWILNLVERVLEVHRDPRPDPTAPYGHSYANRFVTLECEPTLLVPATCVRLADLI